MSVNRICFFMLLVALALLSPMAIHGDDSENAKLIHKLVLKPNVARDESAQIKNLFKKITNRDSKQKAVRSLVSKGLTHSKPHVFLACFTALRKSKDPAVFRQIAKVEIGEFKKNDEESRDILVALLVILTESKDASDWAVGRHFIASKYRAISTAAMELVGQGAGVGIKRILDNIKKMKGRQLTIACRVLDRLTQNEFGRRPQLFLNWRGDEGKDFQPKDLARDKPIDFWTPVELAGGSYYDVPLELATTLFCMDSSMSMGPDKPETENKSYLDDLFPKVPEGNNSKIWSARKTLVSTLKSLHQEIDFGIITFGGRIDTWDRKIIVEGTNKSKGLAARWALFKTPLTYGTLLFQGLDAGSRHKDVETIYLLSDGAPAFNAKGKTVHKGYADQKAFAESGNIKKVDMASKYKDQQLIIELCGRARICRRQRIYTFYFASTPEQIAKKPKLKLMQIKNIQFMKKIAAIAKGEFKLVELEVPEKK